MSTQGPPRLYLDPRNLNFGALAAERDVEGLKGYFFQSEAFRRLRDGSKSVAMGNRGSGKTAIFKMIAEFDRAKGGIVLEMSPDEYSYELLGQTMTNESKGAWAKQGAYASAWKFVIYVSAMKAWSNSSPGLKTGAAARIYNYLRDNHSGSQPNPIAILISYLKRLEGVKLGNIEASIKAHQLQSLYKLEEINALLDDLNEVCKSRKVTILIDELDRGWDASEDAIAFVAGLFQAATAIPLRTPNIRALISLRRELYENIPALYEDAQKVRDVIEVIEWDERQLQEIITKRIARSYPDLSSKTPEECWNFAFAETLDYRQTRSFNYLVDRTLYRPRELILFCINIQNRAADAGQKLPMTYDVISEAEQSYSSERLKDIAAEYRFQFPGLGSVFETFRGKSYNFSREELELHCLEILVGDYRVSPDAKWCLNSEQADLISILWRVGFLRAQAVGGLKARRRSGSQYLGSHQVSTLNLENVNRFHVHPMFRAHLGMKESKTADG
jgi:hypothetical protein